MEAPSRPCFQLEPTFFGFKPEDRVQNHENIFNLIWFGEGRWNWNDVYHMPIFLRSFWIQRCNEIKSAKKEAMNAAAQKRKSKNFNLPTKPRR